MHRRKSIRLKEYDYSREGAYFVTICTYGKVCVFGEVMEEEVRLNDVGLIVEEEWLRTKEIRPEIELDAFIVMPNHLHGIVVIKDTPTDGQKSTVGTHGRVSLQRRSRSLSSLMAGFKSAATKRINEMRHTPRTPVWQSRFHDHIIRDGDDLDRIREYIIDNPLKWYLDEDNPHARTE